MKKIIIISIFLAWGLQSGLEAFTLKMPTRSDLPAFLRWEKASFNPKQLRNDVIATVKKNKNGIAVITGMATLLSYWGWITGIWLTGSKKTLWQTYIKPNNNLLNISDYIAMRRSLNNLSDNIIVTSSIPLISKALQNKESISLFDKSKISLLTKDGINFYKPSQSSTTIAYIYNKINDEYVENRLKKLFAYAPRVSLAEDDFKNMFIRFALYCAMDIKLYNYLFKTNNNPVLTAQNYDHNDYFWGVVNDNYALMDSEIYSGDNQLNRFVKLLKTEETEAVAKQIERPFLKEQSVDPEEMVEIPIW